jgi:hypothetical protein
MSNDKVEVGVPVAAVVLALLVLAEVLIVIVAVKVLS